MDILELLNEFDSGNPHSLIIQQKASSEIQQLRSKVAELEAVRKASTPLFVTSNPA